MKVDAFAAPAADPSLPAALGQRYARFFAELDLPTYAAYRAEALAACDPRPHVHYGTPYFLPPPTLAAVERLCRALVALLRCPTWRAAMMPPASPFGRLHRDPRDALGSVDLHLGPQGLRIIEVHCNAPGGLALCGSTARALHRAFDSLAPVTLNLDYDRRLADAACGGDRSRAVAVAVSHLPSSAPHFGEYRSVVELLRRQGVTADLQLAREVRATAARPVWSGRAYDDVLSLVIPLVWSRHPAQFEPFMEAWATQPARFFPDPNGWYLTTKQMLPMLGALDRWAPELDDEDRAVLQAAALPAAPLAAFDSVDAVIERFGGLDRLVVKPIEGYKGDGVRVRPSRTLLAECFDSNRDALIVQQFSPGYRVPLMEHDGHVRWVDVRLRAYYLEDGALGIVALTNPPDVRWMLPVVLG